MTKGELEARISRLNVEMDTIMAGHGAYNLLRQYAKGLGTGCKAFERAKQAIEGLIAQAEKDLAALPKPSKFEQAKQGYDDNGDWNSETANYIKALEACRPWVIKNKHNGGILCSSSAPYGLMMFPTKEKAVPYCDHSQCEVVQWEGNE